MRATASRGSWSPSSFLGDWAWTCSSPFRKSETIRPRQSSSAKGSARFSESRMSQLTIVLILLAAAIVMFAINKPRLDAVALIMLVALPLTGALTMGEALAGFSDPNIVLIAALFVIGDGLVGTGVAQRLGDWLIAKAGKNEVRLTVLLMVVVCALGATMSSTAVTAIFIPVALRIAQSTGVGPGRLMMPLSFAALIS